MAELITLGVATQISETQVVLLLAIIALAIIAPRLVRRARGQRSGGRLKDLRQELSDAEQTVRARRTADQALADLLETSREITAQIDTRIRVLNKLVKDADTEARRLEDLLGRMSGGAAVAAKPAVGEASDPEASMASPGVSESGPVRAAESQRRRATIHQRVAALKAQGRSPVEIARLTELSLQEVHLVLQLCSEGKDS